LDIVTHLANRPGIWRPVAPASREALAHLVANRPLDLPTAYLDLLSLSNGGEGDLGVEPEWISIWPAEEVLARNSEYDISRNAPGLLGFATNGGGELLAFDARSGPPYPVVTIPFIAMDLRDAKTVATDFLALISAIGSSKPAA
jgi:SMI1/KNR4 family protein SUKH-1